MSAKELQRKAKRAKVILRELRLERFDDGYHFISGLDHLHETHPELKELFDDLPDLIAAAEAHAAALKEQELTTA